jgi:hypothetical protein
MKKITVESYLRDPEMRLALHASARRERSQAIGRLAKRLFSFQFLSGSRSHGGHRYPNPRGA